MRQLVIKETALGKSTQDASKKCQNTLCFAILMSGARMSTTHLNEILTHSLRSQTDGVCLIKSDPGW